MSITHDVLPALERWPNSFMHVLGSVRSHEKRFRSMRDLGVARVEHQFANLGADLRAPGFPGEHRSQPFGEQFRLR